MFNILYGSTAERLAYGTLAKGTLWFDDNLGVAFAGDDHTVGGRMVAAPLKMTDAARQLITPADGTFVYATDTEILYYGDGETEGGVAIATGIAHDDEKQPADALLTSLAALDGTGGAKGVYLTGVDTAATFALTAAARTVLDDTTVAAMRATLDVPNASATAVSTTPVTLATGQMYVLLSGSDVVNLPAAAGTGGVIVVINRAGNARTLVPAGSDTIENTSTSVADGASVRLIDTAVGTDEWVADPRAEA